MEELTLFEAQWYSFFRASNLTASNHFISRFRTYSFDII